jgi:hypothetical protein
LHRIDVETAAGGRLAADLESENVSGSVPCPIAARRIDPHLHGWVRHGWAAMRDTNGSRTFVHADRMPGRAKRGRLSLVLPANVRGNEGDTGHLCSLADTCHGANCDKKSPVTEALCRPRTATSAIWIGNTIPSSSWRKSMTKKILFGTFMLMSGPAAFAAAPEAVAKAAESCCGLIAACCSLGLGCC